VLTYEFMWGATEGSIAQAICSCCLLPKREKQLGGGCRPVSTVVSSQQHMNADDQVELQVL